MNALKIAIASDHAGFEIKQKIKAELERQGHNVIDLGTNSKESVDYPIYGKLLGEAVAGGRAQFGVAVCGSGQGIMMAANKVPGVRAGIPADAEGAAVIRRHNDANVIAFGGGAKCLGMDAIMECLGQFFTTKFEGLEADGERHLRRVKQLNAMGAQKKTEARR